MTTPERKRLVEELRRCYKCFQTHIASSCSNSDVCAICNEPGHHTLLHVSRSARTGQGYRPSVTNPRPAYQAKEASGPPDTTTSLNPLSVSARYPQLGGTQTPSGPLENVSNDDSRGAHASTSNIEGNPISTQLGHANQSFFRQGLNPSHSPPPKSGTPAQISAIQD